jgi:[histone H3]-trimethyl-L-lysine4 demethylase
LKQFQEKANDFKQGYFENRMPVDPVLNCHRPVTEDDVEREFWRLVSSIEETVEVEYGADIHCTTHGSGFPTAEKNPDDVYAADPWNLNLLPLHPESLFRHIKSDISGMTVPWVYVGMIFSTFCWHNEDHYSYSANYQHFGATKTWYGIPCEDAEKFENAMKEAVPELFETQPDLLFQLVTLLPPEQLKKAGVRVYALDQRAGQMVITFPQAYHAGFNHGFNFNEAVNFAPCDWEAYGLNGVERLQQFRRQPCFSHDELLWTAAEGITSGGLTIQTAKWLAPALDRIHVRELAQRQEFFLKHNESVAHKCQILGQNPESEGACPLELRIEDVDVSEEEYQCTYCKAYAYLSRFKCLATGKVMCLQHAGSHACCTASEEKRLYGEQHVLFYRKADDLLHSTHRKVADKAHLPEAWEEKYEKMLEEEATPSLKTLRTLLSEGEKIPFELPSLPLLKEFVDRCNHWVEEATNYIVRKQQNRRKSEKGWQSAHRKSIGSSQDQKEQQMRNVSNVYRLLHEADQIGFDSPEIGQLEERAKAIKQFQENAKRTLASSAVKTTVEILEELLDEGHSFNVDIPEVEELTRELDKQRWNQKAAENRSKILTIDDVQELLNEGNRLQIPPYQDQMRYYQEQLALGVNWEQKAKELINAETVHYPQLEALSSQVAQSNLPVSPETIATVDQILHKQREAHRQIIDLNERSHQRDYRKRPRYAEVVDIMKKIEDLQSKPHGTLDLEKEQKRHEDWMRKGKRLFGKSNAPLHILKSHMEYVLDRNQDCFDITHDKPRLPAEPASREPSPEQKLHRWEDPRFREVFCICRRVEMGMMIECELCHEWLVAPSISAPFMQVED